MATTVTPKLLNLSAPTLRNQRTLIWLQEQDNKQSSSRRLIGFVAELDADAGSAVLGRWDAPDARWVHCERVFPRLDSPR